MRKPKQKGNSAVAYIRVSTGKQVDEGNSIESLKQRIMDYARMRGRYWNLCPEDEIMPKDRGKVSVLKKNDLES